MTEIFELRDRVLELLGRVHDLLPRAGDALERDEAYRVMADAVASEIAKVRALELRMSIVAPMKAGKSTIINAIIGRSVLPTRNSAMTTVPTEIVRDAECRTPTLTLAPATLALFQRMWKDVRQAARKRGAEAVVGAAGDYPELVALVTTISEQKSCPLAAETRGLAEVQLALTLLNDLRRLVPSTDRGASGPSPDTMPLPRLAVPRYAIRSLSQTSSAGRLVIIDTPGPNEATQHLTLEETLVSELRRTSVVLLVLDYTQLNTTAAEAVAGHVRRVIAAVGEENLFVLVNKIDERLGENSLSPSDVRRFVGTHLKLPALAESDRIFEVSAKHAFAAARVLTDIEELGKHATDENVRALPSAIEIAPHVFGHTAWREDLREATTDRLKRRAEKLWELSRFDAFLDAAIRAVLSDAGTRCLRTALHVTRGHLLTLRNDTTLQSKALTTERASLDLEIGRLDDELRQLEKSRATIDARISSTRRELVRHLDETRRGLQSGAAPNVEEFFREAETADEGLWQTLVRSGFQFFGRDKNIQPTSVTFKTEAEARGFIARASAYSIERLRPRIERELQRVDARVEQCRAELEARIEDETRPILDRAARRLRKQFDVEMRRALERHEAGEARVIPVIVRECDWTAAPFAKLQALPETQGQSRTGRTWTSRSPTSREGSGRS